MNKIGIKIVKNINYEQFESFQYLLDYDFDYDILEAYIEEGKIIELDIDDDDIEDREEDIEALATLLEMFDKDKVVYELYLFENSWEKREIHQIKHSTQYWVEKG